jgi:hypothetical protein
VAAALHRFVLNDIAKRFRRGADEASSVHLYQHGMRSAGARAGAVESIVIEPVFVESILTAAASSPSADAHSGPVQSDFERSDWIRARQYRNLVAVAAECADGVGSAADELAHDVEQRRI